MRSWVLAGLAALMLAVPTLAAAEVKPLDPEESEDSATAAALAIMPETGQLESADLPEYAFEEGVGDVYSPIGLGQTPLDGFPTNGSSFAILSSGDVAFLNEGAPQEGIESGTFKEEFPAAELRGSTVDDSTELSILANVPSGANCIALDYRFLSEEYPDFVGSEFNDAFLAELETSSWSMDEEGTLSRPSDFATAPDAPPASVNGVGPSAMSPVEAEGTYFNAATGLVTTKTPITPGSHQIDLSIFDAGDDQYDSAVFLDNLRFINEGASTCKPPSGTQLEVQTNPPPPPPATPSNAFTLGSSVKFKGNGTQATITVTVPGPGTVSASSGTTAPASAARASLAETSKKKGKAKKKPVLKPASTHAAAAGPVSLTLKLSSAGKAALKKKGKLKVGVAITFTPDGGSAATQQTSVTFKAAKKKKSKK
jgi:hypothetical protein